jgi:hypothetical protein
MLRTTGALLALILALPQAGAAAARKATGAFAEGERYLAPADHAPPQVSRSFMTTVTPKEGRAAVEIPATGAGRLILWTIPRTASGRSAPRRLSSVDTPGGSSLRADQETGNDGRLRRRVFDAKALGLEIAGEQEAIHVSEAEAGPYRLEVDTEGADAVTVVAAEPDSPLTLATWAAPLSRRRREPVVLKAELRDDDAPALEASVTARLAPPKGKGGRAVRLFDDGAHGDGLAGDGLYAATLTRLPEEADGLWTVRFEAAGRDGRGHAFARTGSAGFVSEPEAARLLARFTEARFVDGENGRVLRVSSRVRVETPGLYRFDVIVAGAREGDGSRAAVAWAEATDRLGKGERVIEADIPTALLDGASGPLLLDVRLVGLDPLGLAGRTTIEVGAGR